MRILGIVLILLGTLALAFRRITYTTRRDEIHVGVLDAEVRTKKTVPLPPLFGVLTIAGGIVLVVAGSKRPR